jgi:hypothetical protein
VLLLLLWYGCGAAAAVSHLSDLPKLLSAECFLLHQDAAVTTLGAVRVLLDRARDLKLGQTDGGPGQRRTARQEGARGAGGGGQPQHVLVTAYTTLQEGGRGGGGRGVRG